jgi:hypothetical protein
MFQWIGNGATRIVNRIRQEAPRWGFGGVPNAPTSERDPSPDESAPPGEKLKSSPRIPYFLPYYDDQQNLGETQLMRLAYRRMLSDPHVKAAILGKILAVMGQELQILPHNKKNVRDTLISDFTRWCLVDRISGGLPGLVWSVLSGGLIDGFSVCEKVWELEEEGQWKGKEVLAELKPKDVNQDLVLEVDEFKNVTAIKGLRYNSGQEFNPDDFVLFTFLPLYGNPTGMSDLRSAYAAYWFLNTVTKLRALGAEKRALPVIAGEYKDATKQKGLENALSRIKSSNWLAVPAEVKLQVLDIAGRSEEYFKSFRADLVEEIFLGIQGATLQSLAGQSGVNVGRSTTHKDTSDLFKWVLSEFILQVFNSHKKGLIRDIVTRNFVGCTTWPKGSYNAIDAEGQKDRMALMQQAQAMGWVPSKEAFGEEFSLKWGTGDDALMPQQPGGAGMGGAGAMGGDGADEMGQLFSPENDPFASGGGTGFPEGDSGDTGAGQEVDQEGFSEKWQELPAELFDGVFS